MKNIGHGRALKVCDACGGVDDHPRHILSGAAGLVSAPSAETARAVMANAPADDADRLLAELLDTSTVELHRDCCRERGCPTGECPELTAGAEDKRGAALLEHLVNLQTREG